MTTLNRMDTFFAHYLYNIIYFIIIFIDNKFISNFLKNIRLSNDDQAQILLYEFSGILLSCLILILFKNIIKIKNILIISIIIYFFSTLCIIYVDNNEVGKLFFYTSYSFGAASLGFILIIKLLLYGNNNGLKIISISVSCVLIFLFIEQYFIHIKKFINLDFYELIVTEIFIFLSLLIFNIIYSKKNKYDDSVEHESNDEKNFVIIINFSKTELLNGFIMFLILNPILNKFYLDVNITRLTPLFINNISKILSFVFLFTSLIIILYRKINIQKLNAFSLFCAILLFYIVINIKFSSYIIVILWNILAILFYGFFAANLLVLTKKFEGENRFMAILLYFTACVFGFYNGYIISILKKFNSADIIIEHSIYFVIFSLLVYHLYLLNRHRIKK